MRQEKAMHGAHVVHVPKLALLQVWDMSSLR